MTICHKRSRVVSAIWRRVKAPASLGRGRLRRPVAALLRMPITVQDGRRSGAPDQDTRLYRRPTSNGFDVDPLPPPTPSDPGIFDCVKKDLG